MNSFTTHKIRRALTCVTIAGLAFLSAQVHARVSLGDLASQVGTLRATACGELDAATCASAADPAILARIEALESQVTALEPILCELAQASEGAVSGNAIGCIIEPEPENAIRLVNRASPAEGRVEILNEGVWGSVCDDRFGAEEAIVACRQAGFDTGVPVYTREFGPGSGQIWLDDLVCTGSENSLLECGNRGLGVHNCSHFEDIGVRCEDIERENGDLRLMDGTSDQNGRLEVHNEGTWGTVCDDAFNSTDATVACRQLGFTSGTFIPISRSSAPAGTGPILLDDVRCTGSESLLVDCPHRGIGLHNCSHFEDVALDCQ